jgi:hypothetical protein
VHPSYVYVKTTNARASLVTALRERGRERELALCS